MRPSEIIEAVDESSCKPNQNRERKCYVPPIWVEALWRLLKARLDDGVSLIIGTIE